METNSKTEKDTVVENTETKEVVVKNNTVAQEVAAPKEKADKKVDLVDVGAKIVRQLEYYFSDTNLPYDKFLLSETKADDGWVKISVLLTFNRLASISKDPSIIASSIKNAADSILEVDETNEKIRRKQDCVLPVADQEYLDEMIERSVYCKGFPKTATMDDLLNFASTFGDKVITKVTPRKLKTKEFKGSLYFTFSSKEEAEKFLNSESVRYQDVELERMWEKKFLEEKKLEYAEKQTKRDEKIKSETDKFFKKGFLIKADNLNETVTVDSIKAVCSKLKWQVAFVKIVDEQKLAWIRLKPMKSAKNLLEELTDQKNDLNITFSEPDQETEQSVLNEMTKELKGIIIMKDKFKKEKNKNKGGKRFNNKRKYDDQNENKNKKIKMNNDA